MPAEMLVSVIHSDALAVASAGPQVFGRAASEYLFKHSTVLVPLAERNLGRPLAPGGWGMGSDKEVKGSPLPPLGCWGSGGSACKARALLQQTQTNVQAKQK